MAGRGPGNGRDMDAKDILRDGFDRIPDLAARAADGLDASLLVARVDPAANTIAWLVWHLARVQDAQVSEVAGSEQVWTSRGWANRFGLDLPEGDTGYGHSPDDVARVVVDSPEPLLGYLADVHEATTTYLAGLVDADLDRVVDERWDPPVTLGVRLVSILGDDLEHAGQAAFLRGLLERRDA